MHRNIKNPADIILGIKVSKVMAKLDGTTKKKVTNAILINQDDLVTFDQIFIANCIRYNSVTGEYHEEECYSASVYKPRSYTRKANTIRVIVTKDLCTFNVIYLSESIEIMKIIQHGRASYPSEVVIGSDSLFLYILNTHTEEVSRRFIVDDKQFLIPTFRSVLKPEYDHRYIFAERNATLEEYYASITNWYESTYNDRFLLTGDKQIDVLRDVDNINTSTFDFVNIRFQMVSRYYVPDKDVAELLKKQYDDIKHIAIQYIRRNKSFRSYHVPVNVLRLDKAVLTKDRNIVLTFGIKGDSNEISECV